jgi:hypothetical protein
VVEILRSDEVGLTTFVAAGRITARELSAAYTEFLAESPTPLVLWDLTHATLAHIDASAIRHLARDLARIDVGRRLKGRSALLCGASVDFGIARMLQTYLELEAYDVHVAAFTDRARALDWLGVGHD